MNRHQVLSGACNSGDRCYAVGSVEGIPFTAYASGCNIVILASTFERVQIIPGATHGYVKISALDCSTDTGKIAAAYEDKICIFEPTPLIQTDNVSSHNLDYRWVQTGSFTTESTVAVLSWNLEGTRLLTGGALLQMWKEISTDIKEEETPVKFEIGEIGEKENKNNQIEKDDNISWECIWNCETANPTHHLAFSPDGTLFATCGKNDRLVKIWYENKHVIFPSKGNDPPDYNMSMTFDDSELQYSYVYIAHPRTVTHISWRRTSKYMPKTSVSNMLVTSCLDNICRIWIETVLPDDGLINMTQFDPQASQNPKFRTHRHKHRFIQRLKHMKTCFHIRRNAKNGTSISNFLLNNGQVRHSPIPSLPSSYSVHDFHSYGYHGTGVTSGMHFHLAASINAETDIPLVPSMITSDPVNQNNFILHWLNNKEMYFSSQAESILHELTQKVIDKDEPTATNSAAHVEDVKSESSGGQNSVSSQMKKQISQDESNSDEHNFSSRQHSITHGAISNTTSMASIAHHPTSTHPIDPLDMKIEVLLQDWHHNPDLLFSIHPIDGSFLIWVIEWLDDYYPGSFRQAQISFSTRIPSAFPLGDAMSMSSIVNLYNIGTTSLYYKEIVRHEIQKNLPVVVTSSVEAGKNGLTILSEENESIGGVDNANKEVNDKKNQENTKKKNNAGNVVSINAQSSISMVTKHANGTLNLWLLNFADKTKFTQVLSVGHLCRASGHRFRVNDITCHPVLPLLLTTSHHNLPELKNFNDDDDDDIPHATNIEAYKQNHVNLSGFCSELILWRVDSVGPLSNSGGVSELARISSPKISAFSNVAWIPTLLPSTTLGSYSNSPSACFVASDGESLRVFQAVIDARTLLAEISCSERINKKKAVSLSSLSSEGSSNPNVYESSLHDKIKIVSQQSTSRPGCIIQLDAIQDATHDWQNTQFLHVFQEQLITGVKSERQDIEHDEDVTDIQTGLLESQLGAMVDLERNSKFEEPFFIVVIEKNSCGSTIHMWKITIASKPDRSNDIPDTALYVPDSNLVQDVDEGDPHGVRSDSICMDNQKDVEDNKVEAPHISIITKKVCTQKLPMPEDVEVIHASPAAGHLSSSSIYPACFAPYLFLTACSDSVTRFWKCNIKGNETSKVYEWNEWNMLSETKCSAIEISGQPLNISAAYSGRVACAFKYGKSFTRPNKGDPDSRYVNLCVTIYECESTGGSEWILEDTIHLRNIHLPRIEVDRNLDLSYLSNNTILQKKQRINQVLHTYTGNDESRSYRSGDTTPDTLQKPNAGILAVPSFSTLQSLKKSITENGNNCPLTQKHLVQLDWVSKEDGSHILTVAVGSKILLYTPVSSDLAQANIKAMKESKTTSRPLLRKASSLAQPHFNDEIRWMKLRQIDLETADGLPPLPMHMSWVRDGILVVGMDSEMHVYSQWKSRFEKENVLEDPTDTRNLRDEDLRTLAYESSQLRLNTTASISHISKISSTNLQLLSNDKKKKAQGTAQAKSDSNVYDYMTDCGLFQASRIACPVLPQYHPKQLMELLNSGKIRWVKAILRHLVRCMNGTSIQQNSGEGEFRQPNTWSRSRTLSMSYAVGASPNDQQRESITQIPEEVTLDYAEITSIPPLPLWVLLTADKERKLIKPNEDTKDYEDLFDIDKSNEDSLDDLLANDSDVFTRADRRQSIPEKSDVVSHFGPREGQLLSRLLTHTHLPGLSSLDQMHLLALADTVSTCNTDFTERFAIDAARKAIAKENADPENISYDSLDDCGLRFLLAMKHYNYLLRCLPIAQRNSFQKQGVGTSNIVWAFHSESEEELLSFIPSYTKGQLKWSTLKELGVGWWLRNITLLRTCIEVLAKCAYQQKQDPLDAALFYLAMKKKSLVWGLYRSKRDEKMTQFFANNFNENRWRKAALKNAFVLLGKQRFEHAVAFFLLANSLNDAIEVCLNKLEDLQLALVISRLFESDVDFHSSTYKKLLNDEILGNYTPEVRNLSKIHPDPFLRSMSFWILKQYSESLNTLLLNNVGQNHHAFSEEDILTKSDQTTNPNVFNFYIYLRTHPLLIRHHIASTAQEKNRAQVILSGFSYGGGDLKETNENHLQIEDAITPLERQLYFTTAHGHFKAGCPALALEVLNKLPSKVLESNISNNNSVNNSENATPKHENKADLFINTGTLSWDHPVVNSNDFNCDFDWGAPVTSKKEEDSFQIKWDEEDEDKKSEDDNEDLKVKESESNKKTEFNNSSGVKFDIMAQQLKFVACLKILMEELSTLATGFEVDGGQLRFQLYIWLEREVDALKQLCNYSTVEDQSLEELNADNLQGDVQVSNMKPTLHEILQQEKQDFEAKVKRAARRKLWLKANETLLRTLLSYCSLHGASGGGLASVRMELILLLQELQQEKTQQQLLSPLPFPTTLPLLSACVAGNKTVIADPIKYLQSNIDDILQAVSQFYIPEIGNKNSADIFVLKDLSVALSSCIYQSLCDSETFTGTNSTISSSGYQSPGIENIAKLNASCQCSHLMVNASNYKRKRYLSVDEPAPVISTQPPKWPGVTNLRALLAREKDEDIPRLNVLLLEAFTATYSALLVYGLTTCDSHVLFRLAAQSLSSESWAKLFGGGAKKLLRKATMEDQITQNLKTVDSNELSPDSTGTESGVWNTVTSLTKQRVRLNMKLLGQFNNPATVANMKENKATYREQFVPPEMSMVSFFLLKPKITGDVVEDDYDTDQSIVESEEENDEDVFAEPSTKTRYNNEHLNPQSYAWTIMRCAIVKLAEFKLKQLINTAGIENQELPVSSPLSHEILRTFQRWQNIFNEELTSKGPASNDFIPGCFVDNDAKGPAIHKYRNLLEKHNTPFDSNSSSAGPARRLWNYLVRQEQVQDIFIRSIFGKRRYQENNKNFNDDSGNGIDSSDNSNIDAIKIIHKDQEAISAFCLNNSSEGLMCIATPKEIQELDISLLLNSPSWYEDECEYDIINLTKDADAQPTSSFLVIQTPADKNYLSQASTVTNQTTISGGGQSGRGTSMVLKHRVDNVKRMSSHPLMPLYLTGGQDGAVQLWEWGHQQAVCTPRPPGTFAKVTRCRFSQHGNKFGIADGDGNLSLWQAGIAAHTNRSFFAYQCHNKLTSDFVFLGSCSLVATAGSSSENKNVAIWDTLLPQKKSLIHAFTCHDQGSSSLIYAPQHQILLSGGKKGDVCIFDVRQRTLKHKFQAHEGPIKCMGIDPNEGLFVTGSAEGDIKAWDLAHHTLLYSYPGEHARGSFFKHIGQGVSQLQIDHEGRLFSCGSDGSMKVRQLPNRDSIVHSIF